MKQKFAHIVLLLMAVCNIQAQTIISGTISDGKETLAGANVFILGTIEGCLSDSLGRFSFTTTQTGEVTLKVTILDWLPSDLVRSVTSSRTSVLLNPAY